MSRSAWILILGLLLLASNADAACLSSGNQWQGNIDSTHDCCFKSGTTTTCIMKNGDYIVGDLLVNELSGSTINLVVPANGTIYVYDHPGTYQSKAYGDSDSENELVVHNNAVLVAGKGAKFRLYKVSGQPNNNRWGGIKFAGSGRASDNLLSVTDKLSEIDISNAINGIHWASTNPLTLTDSLFSSTVTTGVWVDTTTAAVQLSGGQNDALTGVRALLSKAVSVTNMTFGTNNYLVRNAGSEVKLNGITATSTFYGVLMTESSGTKPLTEIRSSTFSACSEHCVGMATGVLLLYDSSLTGNPSNTTTGRAGVYMDSGSAFIENTTIQRFQAANSFYVGAGVQMKSGYLSLTRGSSLSNVLVGVYIQQADSETYNSKIFVEDSSVDAVNVGLRALKTSSIGGSLSLSVSRSKVAAAAGAAIETDYAQVSIKRSQLTAWASWGASLGHTSPAPEIVNNLLLGRNGILLDGSIAGSQGHLFHNTVVCTNSVSSGIRLSDTTVNVPYMVGNLVSGCQFGFEGLPTGWKTASPQELQYNNAGGCTYKYAFRDGSNLTTLGSNTALSPQFVGSLEFALKGSSPLRERFNPPLDLLPLVGYNVDDDLLGFKRTAKRDIGCYETPGFEKLTPNEGAQGMTRVVTLNGSNFYTVAIDKVTLSVSGTGVSVSKIVLSSSTAIEITLQIAANATLGARNVTLSFDGVKETVTNAFYVRAAPAISSLTPSQIHQLDFGRTLTVTGTGFVAGDVHRLRFTKQGGTTIYELYSGSGGVYSPGAYSSSNGTVLEGLFIETSAFEPGLYDLVVENQSTGGLATKKGALRITATPNSTSVKPSEIPSPWTTGTLLYLTGTFNAGDTYEVALVSGQTTIPAEGLALSSTSLRVTLGAYLDYPAGQYDIVVTNSVDGGSAACTAPLKVNPKLELYSASPAALAKGTTTTVTVTGANIQPGATVQLPASVFSISNVQVSPTMITLSVTVGAQAPDGTYALWVLNPDGGNQSLENALTIGDLPVISSLTPDRGVRGVSPFTVVIDGANFKGSSPNVSFGSGISVSNVVRVSDQRLTATLTIAKDATLGSREVTVIDSQSGLTAKGTFIVLGEPTVTSVTPAVVGQNADGVQLRVAGSGFVAGATLTFSGNGVTVLNTSVVSANELLATVKVEPTASLGTRDVTVKNKIAALGEATLPAGLTVQQGPTISDVTVGGLADYREIGQNADALTLTIAGANFSESAGKSTASVVFLRKDGANWVADEKIEVKQITIVAPGKLDLTIDVAPDAVPGVRLVRLTNSDHGSTTWTDTSGKQLVVVEAPQVTSVEPSQIGLGASALRVKIVGTRLPQLADASVDFGTGISVTVVSVTPDGSEMLVDVSIAPSTGLGVSSLVLEHKRNGARHVGPGFEVVDGPLVANVQPVEVKQGATGVEITIDGSFFGDAVTVTTTRSDVEIVDGSTKVSGGTTVTFTINVANDAKTGPIELRLVNDATGGGVDLTTNIAVTTNRAPAFDPALSDAIVNIGDELVLLLNASDPDSTDALTISASDTLDASSVKVDGVQFTDNGDGTARYSWTPTQLGSYSVTFSVTDGFGGSQSSKVTISVVDPPAQITLPSSLSCVDGFDGRYTFSACDPQGKPLTVSVELTDAQQNKSVLTPTKVADTVCTYEVTIPCSSGMVVKVLANDGASTTEQAWSIDVNFNTPPEKPVISDPANNSIVNTLRVSFDNAADKTTVPGSPTVYSCIACDTQACDGERIELDDVAESNSGTTTCEFPSEALKEDTTYYLRVVARDGLEPTTLFSESDVLAVTYSTKNDPPTAPTLSFPADKGFVDKLKPSVTLLNALDPERQVLTYTIEIASDDQFLQIVETLSNVAENPAGSTSATLVTSLEDHKLYYWRARATDSEGAQSPWSAVWSFRVNTQNKLPGQPTLLSPADGAVLTNATPTLCWTNVTDGDGDPITYVLELATEATFNRTQSGYQRVDAIAPDPSGTTCYPLVTPLAEDGSFVWRVTASDGLGGGEPSTAWGFRVNATNTAPTVPELVSPVNDGTETANKPLTFVFRGSSDADGDTLTYRLVLLSSAAKTDVVATFDSIPHSASANGLIDYIHAQGLKEGVYYWYVSVSDGVTSVDSAETWMFTVTPTGNTTGSKSGGCQQSEAPTSPISLALLLFALGGLVARRRRRATV